MQYIKKNNDFNKLTGIFGTSVIELSKGYFNMS